MSFGNENKTNNLSIQRDSLECVLRVDGTSAHKQEQTDVKVSWGFAIVLRYERTYRSFCKDVAITCLNRFLKPRGTPNTSRIVWTPAVVIFSPSSRKITMCYSCDKYSSHVFVICWLYEFHLLKQINFTYHQVVKCSFYVIIINTFGTKK